MYFPFPGIGIVFDIDGLGGGYYGWRAWQLFMKYIDPRQLAPCILIEGDTNATLNGQANEFCIGIYGPMLDLNYIRETFEGLEDSGLAPVHRRFIEKLALDHQSLPSRGRIDALGRLVTDHWSSMDHALCKGAHWSYCPDEVPLNLEPKVREELEQLKRPYFD